MNPLIAFDPRKYKSHLLIVICVAVYLASQVFPLLNSFGMNSEAFYTNNYIVLPLQILLYQFLHGSLLHIAFNSYFLYQI